MSLRNLMLFRCFLLFVLGIFFFTLCYTKTDSTSNIQQEVQAKPTITKPAVDPDKEWFMERSMVLAKGERSNHILYRLRDHEEGVVCYVLLGNESTYGGYSATDSLQCMRVKP